jgi:hypothetical protein
MRRKLSLRYLAPMSSSLLIEYSKTIGDFLALANQFTPAELTKCSKEGEWSGAYVIHHMSDAESFFSTRFLNALAEDNPKIVPFNEDVFSTALNYAKRDPQTSIKAIVGISTMIIDVLKNIGDADWNRKSIHPESGEMTITAILEKVISHYKGHTNQLREIKESL